MKKLLFLTLALSAGHLLAESAIPKAYDRERYEETVAESPFALATPPAEGPAPEPEKNVLTDLFITGLTQQDGKDYVLVRGVGDSQSIMLEGNTPYNRDSPYNGVFVQQVNWADRYNAVSVTLGHGSLTRQVQFKKEAAAVMGAPRTPGMLGQPNAPGGQVGPGGQRFGQRGAAPGAAAPSLIPQGLDPSKQARPGNNPGGRNLAPGMARAPGSQNISGNGVPRPGGGGNGYGRGGTGGNNGGATTTSTPNAGPGRTRDRGPIRNGTR